MIVALHGFLGEGADWQELRNGLPEFSFWTPSLFSPEEKNCTESTLLQRLEDLRRQTSHLDLLGYSWGGRRALRLWNRAPHLFRRVICVSAHPGLVEASAREERRKRDEAWARRFEGESWESLMRDWNAQPVFQRSAHPIPTHFVQRSEAHFQRSSLARALREDSLATQRDFREFLKAPLGAPWLWICGAEDGPFVEISRTWAASVEGMRVEEVSNSGHRVPWEQPGAFAQIVKDFLAV